MNAIRFLIVALLSVAFCLPAQAEPKNRNVVLA